MPLPTTRASNDRTMSPTPKRVTRKTRHARNTPIVEGKKCVYPCRKASKEDRHTHTKAMKAWKEKYPAAYKKHNKDTERSKLSGQRSS